MGAGWLVHGPPERSLIAAFATTLRTARGRAGLTQEELAERSEVSVRAVSFMETGKRQPFAQRTRRLGARLGMPMSKLVEEIEDDLLGQDGAKEASEFTRPRDWRRGLTSHIMAVLFAPLETGSRCRRALKDCAPSLSIAELAALRASLSDRICSSQSLLVPSASTTSSVQLASVVRRLDLDGMACRRRQPAGSCGNAP